MLRGVLTALTLSAATAVPALAADAVIYADQGANWTPNKRADFYTRDQGARMIPLAWFKALKQPNGQPFLADSLARYGYLPNPEDANGLPIGFTASGLSGDEMTGMNCSACHTRQITAAGKTYRIDGGPAIADFQSFLADLDTAVGQILGKDNDAAFQSFAKDALGPPTPDPEEVTTLRKEVEAWYERYHMLMSRALPNPPWGPARLDALSMIFNRITGLDLGPPPSFIIAENIKPADAPVRYPFLWNASRQDKTQWPGFAENGNDVLALPRNLGQVLGVFGEFEPGKGFPLLDTATYNSANFDNLTVIEKLVKQIDPPKWPSEWPIETDRIARGKAIYQRATPQGGCVECHSGPEEREIKPGKVRFKNVQTWDTPTQNVGTDTREYDVLGRKAKSGVLKGAFIPLLTAPLGEEDFVFNILTTSVVGSIIKHTVNSAAKSNPQELAQSLLSGRLARDLTDVQGGFVVPSKIVEQLNVPLPKVEDILSRKGAYESRVLQGIWATAPYLHNGSVPTLAELLKPPGERVKSFKIGNAYDTKNVGLAVEQTQFNYTLTTTGCETPAALNSGNSNCGHDYGTHLSADEKESLLEYLKTL